MVSGEIVSPKPRSPRSIHAVERLEGQVLASNYAKTALNNTSASIWQQSKAYIPHSNTGHQAYNNNILQKVKPNTALSGLPSFTNLGLAAEEDEESFFVRIKRLQELGALTDSDRIAIHATVAKISEQWYTMTNGYVDRLRNMSLLPNDHDSWRWADVQLAAEDREDSLMYACRKLAALGFWSEEDEKGMRELAVVLSKKWLVAGSQAEFGPMSASNSGETPTVGAKSDSTLDSYAPAIIAGQTSASDFSVRQDLHERLEMICEEVSAPAPAYAAVYSGDRGPYDGSKGLMNLPSVRRDLLQRLERIAEIGV